MVSIALVSALASGATHNTNTTTMLTNKGHTVTFFDEDAVTAGNLSAFGLIYLNRVGNGKTTLAGYLRGYMRTDNIPIIMGPHNGDAFPETSTTGMAVLLGMARSQHVTAGDAESATDAVLVTGFEELQPVAGMDPDLPIYLRQEADTGGYIACTGFHKGQACMKDAAKNVIMFIVEVADLSIQDQLAFGARAAFIWGSGRDDHGKDGAAIINATINWATNNGTFDFPTAGNHFALSETIDLTRLRSYRDSAVDWTEVTPASTAVAFDTSIDADHKTFTSISKGGEVAGLDSETFTTDFATNPTHLLIAAHPFSAADRVRLTTTGTLPAGLLEDTDYFVLVVDGGTIQVELSVGGGAVSFTDDGSGTHTVGTATAAEDAVLKANLSTSVAASTPEVESVNTVLEGHSGALLQLGTGSLADPDALAEDGWYDGGLVTWLTGPNEGISMEVKLWVNGTRTLTLFVPMVFPIGDLDRFTLYPGCRKDSGLTGDCIGKFDNIVNFRGEPFVPGNDQLIRTPDVGGG